MDIEKIKQLRLEPDARKKSPPAFGKNRTLLFLFLLVAVGSFLTGFYLRPKGLAVSNKMVNPSIKSSEITSVSPSQNQKPGRSFTAAGYVEPAPPYPVKITALVSGRLELFELTEGELIEKDQIIGQLDNTALIRRHNELNAAVESGIARVDYAKTVASRTFRLAEVGSISRSEAEQAQAELAVLKAEKKQREEELATIDWQIKHTEIRSPVRGVLFERLAHSGQWIDLGAESAIASLYDPEHLQIWVDINQRDAERVQVEQRAEITLDAEPGRVFKGRVSRILPRASISKNTFQVKIALEETSVNLRPDMSVKVVFLTE